MFSRKIVLMSFQQQIPLAGQEFRPLEQPPTPLKSLQPPIDDNTEAQGTVNNQLFPNIFHHLNFVEKHK